MTSVTVLSGEIDLPSRILIILSPENISITIGLSNNKRNHVGIGKRNVKQNKEIGALTSIFKIKLVRKTSTEINKISEM